MIFSTIVERKTWLFVLTAKKFLLTYDTQMNGTYWIFTLECWYHASGEPLAHKLYSSGRDLSLPPSHEVRPEIRDVMGSRATCH